MKTEGKMITILLADDDADDRKLTSDAFAENRLANQLSCVEDGEELMDYLHRRGKYEPLRNEPLPGLILLDLNMPRKDGREALLEIKSEPTLQHIPIVILTTSEEQKDMDFTARAGAESFFTKPATFDEWVRIMKTVAKSWLEKLDEL